LEEYRDGKRRDSKGTWDFKTGVESTASVFCRGGVVKWWDKWELDVRSDVFDVLECKLGGDVGQEDNAAGEKKSTVKELADDGT
jgi:hypothetical protein